MMKQGRSREVRKVYYNIKPHDAACTTQSGSDDAK